MAFPENTVNDTGIKHIWDKVTTALSGKVDKVSGKGLSTNDYTTAEKEKLSGIEAGAQVNAVTSVAGKTGAVTLDKADVGLGNVDNTSDASKPISTATQNALDTKADTSEVAGTQTVSGNPITLTDASETYAQGLTVELEPKQDLHEQSAPYVGGAGKNKISPTFSDWLVDGPYLYMKINGFNNNIYNMSLVDKDTSVDISGCHIGFMLDYPPISQDYNWVISNGTVRTDKRNVSIREGGAKCDTLIIYPRTQETFNKIFARYDIQVEEGTEATPFAPYSNICPISGYTECDVDDVGFNLISQVYDDKYINHTNGAMQGATGFHCTDYIRLYANETYYFKDSNTSGTQWGAIYTLSDKTFISAFDVTANTEFTAPAYDCYFRITIANAESCINKSDPNKNGTFEPYQSRTASVTFGQTVYGGSVDVTNGVLTVDKGNYSITENTTISRNSDYSFYFYVTGIKAGGSVICDRLESSNAQNKYDVFVHPTLGAIRINTADPFSTGDALRDFLLGAQFVFDLAEPFTIQLTPEELKLLQDTNNITTNGTTITLDYIPNNSIGDAVKASEEYTDRAVERVAPKATLIDTWMISEESDTISVDLTSYDCNFFLLEYLFQSKRGTTLIPRPQGGSFSASVVTYNNGTPYYIELDYNPTTKELAYTSNVTSQFGILAIYTI